MPWFRIAIAAAIAFAAWWVASNYIEGREDRARDAGRAEVQARWDKAENQRREVADKAEKDSRARERSMQEKANAAIATANQRALRSRAAADAARSELDRLRNVPTTSTVADHSRGPEDTCRTADDRTLAVRQLLEQCGAELETLARKADGHLRDALTLHDAWPN